MKLHEYPAVMPLAELAVVSSAFQSSRLPSGVATARMCVRSSHVVAIPTTSQSRRVPQLPGSSGESNRYAHLLMNNLRIQESDISDLSVIQQRLEHLEYQRLKDFTRDMTRMFENARIFYPRVYRYILPCWFPSPSSVHAIFRTAVSISARTHWRKYSSTRWPRLEPKLTHEMDDG